MKMKMIGNIGDCVVMLLAATAGSSATAKDLGKIMPMGDSITEGVPVAGGYRDPLCRLLKKDGCRFTLVGSNIANPTSSLTAANQSYHEGHSGYIINGCGVGATRVGLTENLAAWIGPKGAVPDAILLMIGTNDLGTKYDVTRAPSRLNDLIEAIYSHRPNVSLYVASLTPRTDIESAVKKFNAALPGIVAAHRTKGRKVYFVNMHDALAAGDLSDIAHPNARGYEKMAKVWYDALTASEPGAASSGIAAPSALLGGSSTK